MMRPSTSSPAFDRLAPVRGGEVRRSGRALEVDLDHRVPLRPRSCWRACGRAGCRRCSPARPAGRTPRPPGATRRSAPSQLEMSSVLATASPPRPWISLTTSWAGPASRAGAVHGAAQVVDDDLGAVGRQHQRVLPPDAAPGAGHDAHPSLAQPDHGQNPPVVHVDPAAPGERSRRSCHPTGYPGPVDGPTSRSLGQPTRVDRYASAHRHRRGLRLRAPHERRRRAHVDHREGPAAAQHHHHGDGLRPPDRPRAPAPAARPREPRHPAAAPAGAGPHAVDRPAAMGARPQLRPRLPRAIDARQRRRGRRARSPDHRRTAARGLLDRRADRHAGLRPGPAPVGVHPRRRAGRRPLRARSRRSTTRSPTASVG